MGSSDPSERICNQWTDLTSQCEYRGLADQDSTALGRDSPRAGFLVRWIPVTVGFLLTDTQALRDPRFLPPAAWLVWCGDIGVPLGIDPNGGTGRTRNSYSSRVAARATAVGAGASPKCRSKIARSREARAGAEPSLQSDAPRTGL